MRNELIWNVYIERFNDKNIEIFNIFDHYYFRDDLKRIYKENKNNKDEFLARIKNSLMYYFWSKCEWEIVLTCWPPHSSKFDFEDKKISVFDQININWHIFSEYIWDNKDIIKNFEEE